MAGFNIARFLLLSLLLIGATSCDRVRQPAPPPRIGMEKPASLIFKDLTRLGFCARQWAPTVCVSHAVGIETISIDIEGSSTETVDILINLGLHHESEFIGAANENAIRLTRYFASPWRGQSKWIEGAIDNGRRAYCPKMIKSGDYYIILGRETPNIAGAYERLVITRAEHTDEELVKFDFERECNYATGRFAVEAHNPPELPYTW